MQSPRAYTVEDPVITCVKCSAVVLSTVQWCYVQCGGVLSAGLYLGTTVNWGSCDSLGKDGARRNT